MRELTRLTKRASIRAGVLAAAAVVVALTVWGGSSSSASSSASATLKPATLQLWLGGVLTTSTPGSTYRQWVNQQIARLEAAVPGTKVALTLLPPDNSQLAAKVESAFAAHQVPDVMMLYSGAYTTAYTPDLLPLNSYINATPGFYASMSNWDLSCANFTCNNGKGTILAVPTDVGGFFLFYNKAKLKAAGISGPPTTFTQLFADCKALKAKHIVPLTYGDRDGYTTVNFLDEDLGSYLTTADGNAMLHGKLKLTDPRIIAALQQIVQLRRMGCVQADATTHEQLDALNGFAGGQTAMAEYAPGDLPQFEKALGSKLGVSTIPNSGHGPLSSKIAADSLDDWVIPKGAKNPALAWEFIKLVSDRSAGQSYAKLLGTPPANIAGDASITDPLLKYMANKVKDPGIPLLDSVLSNAVALYLYRELQLAFAGQTSPQAAMQATQSDAQHHGP